MWAQGISQQHRPDKVSHTPTWTSLASYHIHPKIWTSHFITLWCTVDSRYLDLAYLEQPLISKWNSGPCLNMKAISPLFHNIFNLSLTSRVQLHTYLLKVVNRISFSSILQIWYVEVRISQSISESLGIRDNESRLYIKSAGLSPFLKRRQNRFDRTASLEGAWIPLKDWIIGLLFIVWVVVQTVN